MASRHNYLLNEQKYSGTNISHDGKDIATRVKENAVFTIMEGGKEGNGGHKCPPAGRRGEQERKKKWRLKRKKWRY